jgi:AP-3 complex subunit sigma
MAQRLITAWTERQVHHILSEIVQGGMVLETNMSEIVTAMGELNKMKKKNGAISAGSLSLKASETLRSSFRH